MDSRQWILGVVTRGALQRVAGERQAREFDLERVLGELAQGYLSLCARLLESLLGRSR